MKFIYKYYFQLILIILSLLNLLAITIDYFYGDKDGKIELFNLTENLWWLSIVLLIISFSLYSFINRRKTPNYWIFCINTYLFVALLSLTEIGFYIFEIGQVNPIHIQDKEFRKLRPEPYKLSNYFSNAFINKQYHSSITFFRPSNSNILIPNDYEGDWYNIINNKRHTTNTPKEYHKNVYVFGGSTVWCAEVPDSLTICSILQRLINQSGNKIKVHNLGTPAATISQQIERLQNFVDIKFGDIVIFYDGVNDISSGVYYGKEYGFISGFNAPPTFNQKILLKMIKHSATVRFFYNKYINNYRPHFENIEKFSTDYCNKLRSTYRLVSDQGGIFLHFFQPSIHTKSKLNSYEMLVMERDHNTLPSMHSVYKRTIPIIENCLSGLRFSKNLTKSFDKLEISPYLDGCHVSEIGNKVIATQMFESIQKIKN